VSTPKLGFFIAILALSLSAQPTWNGLRFGMTEAEVQTALAGKATYTPQDDKGFGHLEKITVATNGTAVVVGKGSVQFAQDKLVKVWLDFSRYEDSRPNNDELAMRSITYGTVTDGVVGRYGKPVRITGSCPAKDDVLKRFVYTPNARLKCTALWKDDNQTIEMSVDFVGVALFLTIEYKPLAPSAF